VEEKRSTIDVIVLDGNTEVVSRIEHLIEQYTNGLVMRMKGYE